MKYPQIITDFDDQDCYKFYMNYFIFKNYPDAYAHHKLFFRKKVFFPFGFAEELRGQVNSLSSLTLTKEIEEHFHKTFSYKHADGSSVPYFDSTYYQYLRAFRYNPETQVTINQFGSDIEVNIRGLEHEVMFYECQIMAIISELYFIMTGQAADPKEKLTERNKDKFAGFAMHGAKVSDFGLRRRYSKQNHEDVLIQFMNHPQSTLVGTSDVMLSRKLGLKAHGTMAHEIIMLIAGIMDSPIHANSIMLKQWSDLYRGALGTVLTDTYTTDNFLKSFDLYYAKLYDGPRQDSGDPLKFTDKLYNHYQNIGITLPNGMVPKTVIYSNAINNMSVVGNIQKHAENKIYTSFGIGTWITNDVGVDPLNMVIKIVRVKATHDSPWRFTVKMPDDIDKIMGIDTVTNEKYKREIGIL